MLKQIHSSLHTFNHLPCSFRFTHCLLLKYQDFSFENDKHFFGLFTLVNNILILHYKLSPKLVRNEGDLALTCILTEPQGLDTAMNNELHHIVDYFGVENVEEILKIRLYVLIIIHFINVLYYFDFHYFWNTLMIV